MKTARAIVQIACGSDTSGFLTEQGIVYTFGANESGQLGIGCQSAGITQPTNVKCDELFVQMSLGFKHSLFLTDTDKVFGAGRNTGFELGLGSNQEAFFSEPVRIPALDRHNT